MEQGARGATRTLRTVSSEGRAASSSGVVRRAAHVTAASQSGRFGAERTSTRGRHSAARMPARRGSASHRSVTTVRAWYSKCAMRPMQRTLVPPPARVPREAAVRVLTLGRTEVLTPEGPLGGEWLDQRAGQVLKYLVCERHRVVPADEIAESVCRHPQRSTLSTVRYFIHVLRTKLEPGRRNHDRGSVVVARHGGYTLNHSEVWIDADEFEAQVNSGLAALAHGARAAAAERFETALSLYQGDFLADEPYAEWALMERERLHELAEKPLRALGELHRDDPDAAAALSRAARSNGAFRRCSPA